MANQYVRKPGVDLSLSILCRYAEPGQTLSVADIADVCDCSVIVIRQAENRAIAKLKKRIKLSDHLEP